jgi:flagellar basal body-associated protein FliL|tara:strand:- start:824 stop:1000 length:177 start_codon:yes stop_codon:yes gene_type:complete
MQLSKNTSTGKSKSLLIKIILILVIFAGAVGMLGKIDFPSPNKKIEKFIPNENLKIVK